MLNFYTTLSSVSSCSLVYVVLFVLFQVFFVTEGYGTFPAVC